MITTLIPAYKPQFIGELLLGLANQTFKNFKVIVSDDSPNNEVTALIKSSNLAQIRNQIKLEVIEGPKNGSMANISNLISHWDCSTPLVHFMFDDDVIFPLFYQLHVLAHSNNAPAASVSLRWAANEDGSPHRALPIPDFLAKSNKTIEYLKSEALFKSTIPSTFNWLGEMSNVVLSADSVKKYEASTYSEIPYYGLSDIGTLLHASLDSPLAMINHHLGFFRESSFQNTNNKQSISLKCAYIGWISIILMSLDANKISLQEANTAMSKVCRMILKNYSEDPQMLDFAHLPLIAEINSDKFKSEFNSRWQQLLSQDASWVQSCQMRSSR